MHYSMVTDALADTGLDAKWGIHFAARARVAKGEKIIELTIGDPDLPPSKKIIDYLCERLQAGRIKYSTNAQDGEALTFALAKRYTERTGREIDASNCMFFPGTQAALYTVMQCLVGHGDKVIVPDPYYATYDGVVRATDAEIVSVPLHFKHRFHLDVRDLEAAITPQCRVLLLNSPHNPTGAVLSEEDVREIGEFCRRHDLWIVSDEVYDELCFTPSASPLNRAVLADRTIVVSSISKSRALPGLRCGWCIAPEEAVKRLSSVADSIFFGSQPFLKDTTAFAIENDFPETTTFREALLRRARIVVDEITASDSLSCHMPEGGMFCVVNVSALNIGSQEFAQHLLDQENVAVMPGASFGQFSEDLIRLSLTVPEETLRDASQRIVRLAKHLSEGPRETDVTRTVTLLSPGHRAGLPLSHAD